MPGVLVRERAVMVRQRGVLTDVNGVECCCEGEPPPVGACCLPNGDCLDGVTRVECESQNGVYQGDNVACNTVLCGNCTDCQDELCFRTPINVVITGLAMTGCPGFPGPIDWTCNASYTDPFNNLLICGFGERLQTSNQWDDPNNTCPVQYIDLTCVAINNSGLWRARLRTVAHEIDYFMENAAPCPWNQLYLFDSAVKFNPLSTCELVSPGFLEIIA